MICIIATSDVIATAVQPRALCSTMASCSRVAMNASNKRSRKAKHSGKENSDVATDGDDMDDFLLQKKQGLERWTWTYRILAK